MQKFIRIMAIVAAVLVAFSLLLLLISIPFQRLIASNLFGYPDDIVGALPQFPLMQFLLTFLQLGCMILLVVCCGNKKGGIWLEVIAFILLAVVLPALNQFLSPMYSLWVTKMQGGAYVAAHSVVNRIASYCMMPGSLGIAIGYGVCGMSIVFKRMSKKLEKVVE